MRMNPGESAEADPTQKIIEARDEILEVIQRKMDGAYNSRRGYRPEEDGSYCDGYYDDKERGEIYGSFWRIFNVTDEEAAAYPSLKAYLTKKCQPIMEGPEENWRDLLTFINEELGITIAPPTGPTTLYKEHVQRWATKYRLTIVEVEVRISFEDYAKDSATAIRNFIEGLEI